MNKIVQWEGETWSLKAFSIFLNDYTLRDIVYECSTRIKILFDQLYPTPSYIITMRNPTFQH